MSIAAAFANIGVVFSRAGLGPYVDSFAQWPGQAEHDAGGSIVTPGVPISLSCQCQVDSATKDMRAEEGFVETDVALLVLVDTLDGELDTDATVHVTAGPHSGTYSVKSVGKDTMGTHYLCRGRKV